MREEAGEGMEPLPWVLAGPAPSEMLSRPLLIGAEMPTHSSHMGRSPCVIT